MLSQLKKKNTLGEGKGRIRPTALDRRGPAKHPDLRVVVAFRTIIKNFCSFKPLSLWYFVMAAIRHLILPLKILIIELHCLRFQMFTYSRHCFLMALISGLTQILILTLGHLVQMCRIRAKLVKTNMSDKLAQLEDTAGLWGWPNPISCALLWGTINILAFTLTEHSTLLLPLESKETSFQKENNLHVPAQFNFWNVSKSNQCVV